MISEYHTPPLDEYKPIEIRVNPAIWNPPTPVAWPGEECVAVRTLHSRCTLVIVGHRREVALHRSRLGGTAGGGSTNNTVHQCAGLDKKLNIIIIKTER
jgi:hypothetical protein